VSSLALLEPIGSVIPETVARRPAGRVAVVPTAVSFSHVSLAFDDAVVLRDLSFTVPQGAMRMLLGASGSGKSVVLKLILGLLKPDTGTVEVRGQRIDTMTERELLRVRADIGMVFQENALFDSLTVAENVGYRLSEEAGLSVEQVEARVQEVLGFIGLREYTDRLPSELSGGQRRRVAIARAIAPEPGLLLFDDPITGLDPLVATVVDNEIIKLRDLEDVTSIVVTHQIRDAVYIATHEAVRESGGVRFEKVDVSRADEVRFMVLHEGRLHFEGSAEELLSSSDPYLREYMHKTLPPW